MSTITIAGPVTSALTHFAMFGLAALCDAAAPGTVRLGWTQGEKPRAVVESDGDIGQIVCQSAQDALTWAACSRTYAGKLTMSPLSPRIKLIDSAKWPNDWPEHQRMRWDTFDQLLDQKNLISLELLKALGEPAYWRIKNNSPRPDEGASRWEMKTRNKGQEFFTHRFVPLATEVSSWDASDILAGIEGEKLNDAHGKNDPASRSASGFQVPKPTDNALAWCALWGISFFPITQHVSTISTTPGAFPTTRLHPEKMLLPVVGERVTPSRMKALCSSEQVAICGAPESDHMQRDAALRWLNARGVIGIMDFPILLTGSSSAPERQVLDGIPCPTM